MIFGYQPFTGSLFAGSYIYTNKYNRMDVQNGKFDEIKVDEEVMDKNKEKQEWGYETVLLARFQDNLEAGNIENKGMKIQKLRFKRRNIENLKWETLKDVPFTKEKAIYTLIDKYVESGEIYEYGISPVTELVEGKTTYDKIECEYDGLYVMDSDRTIRLEANLEYGDIDNVEQSSIIETLGSRFPITLKGVPNYKKSNTKALIISDSTIDNGVVNRNEEIRLRKSIIKFLSNAKPKLIKDDLGNFYLVQVMNVKESNSQSKFLYDVSFEWVQIDDATSIDSLKQNGLIY